MHNDDQYIGIGTLLEKPPTGIKKIINPLMDKTHYFRESPLHKAVRYCSVSIVQKLLKKGANINAKDETGSTPLHIAVQRNHPELICMLLYYDADVHIINKKGYTPFVQGLDTCMYSYNLETAGWLLNYYDKFSGKFAMMSTYQNLFRNPIEEDEVLGFIRKIWDKFDNDTMIKEKSTFLSIYLLESLFSIPAWINCLCKMLDTPNAGELMISKFAFLDKFSVSNFSDVICSLLCRNVNRNDRMIVITLWLSFGAQICTDDVRKAVDYYRMNEEVNLLISSAPVPLITLIFALEERINIKSYKTFQSIIIFQFISGVRQAGTFKMFVNLICKSLRYFSWNNFARSMLVQQLQEPEDCKVIVKMLETIPKAPSLVELCRNRIVMIIKKNVRQRKMLRPINYHAAVRRLDVTKNIKDILDFKTPLYG